MSRGKKTVVAKVSSPHTEKLQPSELEEFSKMQAQIALVKSEYERTLLMQQNFFLRLSCRLGGRNVDGCQINVDEGTLLFPNGKSNNGKLSPVPAPPPPVEVEQEVQAVN